MVIGSNFYWLQKVDAAHYESVRVASARVNVEHDKMIAALKSITDVNPKGITDATLQSLNNFKTQAFASFTSYTDAWSKPNLLSQIGYSGFLAPIVMNVKSMLESVTTQVLSSAQYALNEQCSNDMMMKFVPTYIPYVQRVLQNITNTIDAIPTAFGDAQIAADQASKQINLIVKAIKQCSQVTDKNSCVIQSVSETE